MNPRRLMLLATSLLGMPGVHPTPATVPLASRPTRSRDGRAARCPRCQRADQTEPMDDGTGRWQCLRHVGNRDVFTPAPDRP